MEDIISSDRESFLSWVMEMIGIIECIQNLSVLNCSSTNWTNVSVFFTQNQQIQHLALSYNVQCPFIKK